MAKKKKKERNSAKKPELQRVLENFVACDRCSFFLAGYRVLEGLESIEQAVANSEGEWLSFEWNQQTRHLLHKSYGGRLDIDLFYYDGQCPVCQRRYTYAASEEGGDAEQFRIEIKQ